MPQWLAGRSELNTRHFDHATLDAGSVNALRFPGFPQARGAKERLRGPLTLAGWEFPISGHTPASELNVESVEDDTSESCSSPCTPGHSFSISGMKG